MDETSRPIDSDTEAGQGPWIDVSIPLAPGMPVFTGDPTYSIELAASIAAGALCNVSRLSMGAHSGTHFDAPGHFIDGAATTESMPLEAGIGPAWVVDARAFDRTITAGDLVELGIPEGETRILFRTPNSELWATPGFSESFTAIDESAARFLVDRGATLVGADYLSIAPFGDPAPTHRTLLGGGAWILEGLDLRNVEPGAVELLALPLRIVGSDGAPARALVRRRNGLRPGA
jgi:arylformamidase